MRSGRTVSCARALNTQPAADNPAPVAHHMIGTATEGWGADYVAVAPHGFATSHIDALCHVMHEGRLFNGYPAETVTAHGATRLGIHHLNGGVVTRGVLLDIPALRGVDALEPGEPVFPEDLEAAETRAGVRVRPGDALLVRTGRWRWRDEHGPWDLGSLAAGLDASCLPWLRERDVAALGSDGVSDVLPSRVEGVVMPIHTVVIVAMGVHLLDNLDLDALAGACAAEGRCGVPLHGGAARLAPRHRLAREPDRRLLDARTPRRSTRRPRRSTLRTGAPAGATLPRSG